MLGCEWLAEFVIATNPDIILGDQLIGFFAQRQLRTDAFYRIDRYTWGSFLSVAASNPMSLKSRIHLVI